MQEDINIREIIEKYELKIKNIEDKYNLVIESKDEQIEIYKDQIKFLREVIKKNADKTVKIINENINNSSSQSRPVNIGNGNYNEQINSDYIQGNKTDQSRNINITGGNVSVNGAGVFNLGDISGKVTNSIKQLPASSDLDNPGIKELVNQLKKAIEKATELDEADKYDALEEVQHLAQASLYDDLDARQAKAEKSLRMLGRIFTGLPATAVLMNICKEVLPAIAKFFQ